MGLRTTSPRILSDISPNLGGVVTALHCISEISGISGHSVVTPTSHEAPQMWRKSNRKSWMFTWDVSHPDRFLAGTFRKDRGRVAAPENLL